MLRLPNPTIGKAGFIEGYKKREGDMATPLGSFPLLGVWYRPDRMEKPLTTLPVHAITENTCWCDEPNHVLYNHPFDRQDVDSLPKSFEELWRTDNAYNIIIDIGYNRNPIIPHKGSAIFMHAIHDDGRPTAGCVALPIDMLARVVSQLPSAPYIHVKKDYIYIS